VKLRQSVFANMYNCVTTDGRVVGHVQHSCVMGDCTKRWSAYSHHADGDIFEGYAETASVASDLIPH
jgi:hypothetical protein